MIQRLTASVTAGGAEYSVEEITVKRDRFDFAGKTTATVYRGDEGEDGVERDAQFTATLNGKLVFTGEVDLVKPDEEGSLVIEAFNAYRPLQQTTISDSYTDKSSRAIAKEVIEAAGQEAVVNLSTEPLRPGGAAAEAIATGTAAEENAATYSVQNQPVTKILSNLAPLAGGVWYVNKQNQVVLTDNYRRTEHSGDQLLEASAGKRSRSYRSVRVVGTSPASLTGKDGAAYFARELPVASVGRGGPTLKVTDKHVRTAQQAKNMATELFKELQRQRKGGHIDLVGDATIQPTDLVVMPEQFGSDEYFVNGIEHQMANNTGFETRVMCGAPVGAGDRITA